MARCLVFPFAPSGLSRTLAALLGLAACLLASGCAFFSEAPEPPPPGQGTVLDTARSQLGVPYCYGGESPDSGFDCSGFVQWVYARHGVHLPRRTADQIHAGVPVRRGRQEPGDLVFFDLSRSKSSLHSGIVSGRDAFIHSPSSGGVVREDRLSAPYWRNTIIEFRRVTP